jgi:hypothetical protein
MERELTRVAEEKISAIYTAEEREILEFAKPIVTVSKEYLLFGKTTGKVALYTRPKETPGEEENHDEAASGGHQHFGDITGIQFFLEKEDGAWLDKESGRCSSQQCQVEGKEAFDKKRGQVLN